MEGNKFVLSLLVTNEMKLAIEAFFNHSNWDFIEVQSEKESESVDDKAPSEDAGSNQAGSSQAGSSFVNTLDASNQNEISEDENSEDSEEHDDSLCQLCLCSPCVTTNEQSWLGRGAGPSPQNRNKRRIRYKKFWSMHDQRNAWRKAKYFRKKQLLLRQDGLDESVVRVHRE